MAGVMVHLAVADVLTEFIEIKNKEMFYTGNISPDCIHSRVNYCRDMKKHTHLKDEMFDWELMDKNNLKAYHKKLSEFTHKFCNRDNEDFELFLGYYIHLITDEMFVRTVRQEFARESEKRGIYQTDKEFFNEIMRDINGTDSIFAEKYPYNIDIPSFLEAKGFDAFYVTAEETELSKKWILENFYKRKSFEGSQFITYERMLDFISEAVSEILKRTDAFFGCLSRDDFYMREALIQARHAADIYEVPVGAVIVKKSTGEIVGKGFNKRETDKNPIAHAEIEAIREASENLGGWRLIDCEMYVTLEPCPMCCGAVINSRLERIVYGTCDKKSGSAESVTEIFSLPYNHKPELVSGVKKEKCAEILSEFFRKLRIKKQNLSSLNEKI